LRIALRSTPNNGIPSLANFRYLVVAFYRLSHPLRERLGVLGALNMGRCIKKYYNVLS
jgi:hypothetical protein